MKYTITNSLFCLIYILCTIYNKFIITFLFLVVICIFYFVKLYQKKLICKGSDDENHKGEYFSRQDSQYLSFLNKLYLHDINLQYYLTSGIIILLFFRLFTFEYFVTNDFQKIGCRQNRQEIDFEFSGSTLMYDTPSTPSLITPYGGFSIKTFLTDEHKKIIATSSSVSLFGKIACMGPTYLSPFTKEAQMIANGKRGVVTKIYSLKGNGVSNRQIISHESNQTRTSGILRGILFGDTSLMTQETYQLFLDSGLIHLVSASGGNIILLLQIVTFILFFVPFYKRRYYFAFIVCVYFIIIGNNISFTRAVISFFISTFTIPLGYFKHRKNIYFVVIALLLFYNPLYIISSRGLLLSASGVWGLLHIPSYFQRNKIISLFLPSLFAYIALIGPLFFLTHHINILTIPLSVIAQFITSCIILFSPLSLNIHTSFIADVFVNTLYYLAYRGSTYGVFITIDGNSKYFAIVVRIISWLFLIILYNHYHKKHLLSLRD